MRGTVQAEVGDDEVSAARIKRYRDKNKREEKRRVLSENTQCGPGRGPWAKHVVIGHGCFGIESGLGNVSDIAAMKPGWSSGLGLE